MIPLYDLNPHRRFPWVTVLLIVANVVVLAQQGFQPNEKSVYEYGFIAKRLTELRTGKPVVVRVMQQNRAGEPVPGQAIQFENAPGQVYLTLITAMFLHGGWLHLAMNMWMLWVFGNNVEDRLGRLMYLCFYLIGGVIGTLCQWASNPMAEMPMIGASGAVAAVLGGYAITYPKAIVKTLIFFGLILIVDLPALLVLGIWFVLQMASGIGLFWGIGEGHIAFWAHVGGFVAGVILMPILGLGASPPDVDWKKEVQDLFRFDDPRQPTNQDR